jgi:hypothetical protein
MTSVPTTMTGGLPANRAGGSSANVPAPAPSAMGGSIDPIKLVNKYKWLLAAAAVVGMFAGVGAHFLLLRVAPVWTPKAVIKCLPGQTDILQNINMTSDIELSRFIQTQARLMTSDAVLQRLALSSQLREKAKVWCQQFYKLDPNTGSENFNDKAALEKLRSTVKARVIPQTSLVELSVSWRDRDDTTELCRLVTDQYIKLITDESEDYTRNTTKAFRDAIDGIEKEMTQLRNRRESLIKDEKVQSIDDARNQQAVELQAVNEVLLTKTQDREGLLKQLAPLQAMSDTGDIVYPDDMIEEADRDPQVQDARSRVRLIETQRQMLINKGALARPPGVPAERGGPQGSAGHVGRGAASGAHEDLPGQVAATADGEVGAGGADRRPDDEAEQDLGSADRVDDDPDPAGGDRAEDGGPPEAEGGQRPGDAEDDRAGGPARGEARAGAGPGASADGDDLPATEAAGPGGDDADGAAGGRDGAGA